MVFGSGNITNNLLDLKKFSYKLSIMNMAGDIKEKDGYRTGMGSRKFARCLWIPMTQARLYGRVLRRPETSTGSGGGSSTSGH